MHQVPPIGEPDGLGGAGLEVQNPKKRVGDTEEKTVERLEPRGLQPAPLLIPQVVTTQGNGDNRKGDRNGDDQPNHQAQHESHSQAPTEEPSMVPPGSPLPEALPLTIVVSRTGHVN